MDEKIKHQDIDTLHCLGNRKPDKKKPWPIIIKFLRYNVRAKIFKNKRKTESETD